MKEAAIIGGGLAGLAAARALAEHGVGVVVIEAAGRLGGRARTLYHPGAALPIELGPEFVHGDPAHTRELVRDRAIAFERTRERHRLWRGGCVVELDDPWQRFGELLAGARDVDRPDESARSYIVRSQLAPDDEALLAHFIAGFYGAPLDDISIAGVAADDSGAGGDESPAQVHVGGGYQRIVDALATAALDAGAQLLLGCTVHAIDWSARPVRIAYRTSDAACGVVAERAIVTLPVGVLGALQLHPVPGDHLAALARFGMGQVVKIVLCLREPVWRAHDPARLDFVHALDAAPGAFPTYWMRSSGGTHQLTAWAGGAHAQALARVSPEQRVERALAGFARAAGIHQRTLAAAVRHSHAHDHASDPLARGAYSYTRVGGSGAAEQLARPLADRLYFAGEATDAEYEGTVAGALASGARVADQILRGLGARVRSPAA
jgi:monoamine oxidase